MKIVLFFSLLIKMQRESRSSTQKALQDRVAALRARYDKKPQIPKTIEKHTFFRSIPSLITDEERKSGNYDLSERTWEQSFAEYKDFEISWAIGRK